MHTAFVLAAGLGTRLRPLTELVPKPLVPVCGVPMLAQALALCARHGHRDVVVNAHWLAPQIEAWAGEREGVRVTVSVEQPEILGTGGGLRFVRDRLAARFAVVNADVLCDVDLTRLVGAVPPDGAVMALRRDADDARRYGVVAMDEEGVVVELSDVARTEGRGFIDRSTHFTGIHALDKSRLDVIPDGYACVIRTTYRNAVPQRRVLGRVHEGLWLDVGDPSAYLQANLAALDGVALPIDCGRRAAFAVLGGESYGDSSIVGDAQVEAPVWIGPGARIEAGARLRRCVIGAGAVVSGGAEVDEAVVWDGVEVGAEALSRSVAYQTGRWLGA